MRGILSNKGEGFVKLLFSILDPQFNILRKLFQIRPNDRSRIRYDLRKSSLFIRVFKPGIHDQRGLPILFF